MGKKLQETSLNKNLGRAFEKLEAWAVNPWRRASLLLIVLLIGFWIGSSIGMINGALNLMDPVGAFFTVLLLEMMIRLRRRFLPGSANKVVLNVIDITRIGVLYGLLIEGFKLS